MHVLVTIDNVHMNPSGNVMMAKGILRTFGLNEQQIKTANEVWLTIPDACTLSASCNLTLSEYYKLNKLAIGKKTTMQLILDKATDTAVKNLLAAEKK